MTDLNIPDAAWLAAADASNRAGVPWTTGASDALSAAVPLVVAAELDRLAAEANERMQIAHEAAQAMILETHRHDYLGERAAHYQTCELLHARARELRGA